MLNKIKILLVSAALIITSVLLVSCTNANPVYINGVSTSDFSIV